MTYQEKGAVVPHSDDSLATLIFNRDKKDAGKDSDPRTLCWEGKRDRL